MTTRRALAAAVLSAIGLFAAEVPRRYECRRATEPPVVDGKLEDRPWRRAKWTEDFIYITGQGAKPEFRTRVKMLWDDRAMYFAAELEEPHVWATLTEHDSVIFRDPDFEVFLNPTRDTLNYFELELNALNTTWDLFLPRPYKRGGKADNGLELTGLRTAVRVEGTINDPSDRDKGWTVEIEIPWEAYASRHAVPRPRAGEEWRVNFSRVEWPVRVVDGRYEKTTTRPLDWVWSPQGVVDMHIPERWGYVRFAAR